MRHRNHRPSGIAIRIPSDVSRTWSPDTKLVCTQHLAHKALSTLLDAAMTQTSTRRPWSVEEDVGLYAGVAEYGPNRWRQIAEHLGSRNHKQVRERWFNGSTICARRSTRPSGPSRRTRSSWSACASTARWWLGGGWAPPQLAPVPHPARDDACDWLVGVRNALANALESADGSSILLASDGLGPTMADCFVCAEPPTAASGGAAAAGATRRRCRCRRRWYQPGTSRHLRSNLRNTWRVRRQDEAAHRSPELMPIRRQQ
jgi:hypothetical protein